MELTLLNFSKRINSTKKPTAEQLEAGKVFNNLTLKQLTNIDNPNLILAGAKDEDYLYNYAYVKEWDRYYHIKTSDLRHEDIYTAHLELDDLATFKDDILNTSAYIVYSSTGYNRWLRDDRVPMLPSSHYGESSSAISYDGVGWFIDGSNQTVIITAVSKLDGIVHWVTTELGLQSIISTLLEAQDSIFESLSKQFGDAMGSIIQIRRFPINSQALPLSSTTRPVYLGNYALEVNGEPIEMYQLVNTHMGLNGSCSIPVVRTDFRIQEPYSVLRAVIPFIGVVDLNFSDFRDYDSTVSTDGAVYYKLDIDLATGQIIWTIKADSGDGKIISSFSGEIGATIPIASSQIQNASSVVTSLFGGATSIGLSLATANPALAGAGIGAIASGFYNMNQKSTSVLGSYSGGHAEYANKRFRVIIESFGTEIEPSNLTDFEGRPVCKVDLLSNYSGYMKTQGFSIDIDANSDVIKSINSKLDAGIYIE